MTIKLSRTEAGDIVLASEVEQHLGLKPGEAVEADLLPGGEVKLRRTAKGSWSELAGMFYDPNQPPMSIEEMNQIIADGWAGKLK